jgi:2',3'-cyclic-nucleotide 2'-phosphodiesterase (5'-nucleotidase family)
MIPSIETLTDAFGPAKGPVVHHLMQKFFERNAPGCYPNKTMDHIDAVLNGHGVEFIGEGHDDESPAITYVNMGDSYDTTVMWVDGEFRVGSWGDIVEQGNYA